MLTSGTDPQQVMRALIAIDSRAEHSQVSKKLNNFPKIFDWQEFNPNLVTVLLALYRREDGPARANSAIRYKILQLIVAIAKKAKDGAAPSETIVVSIMQFVPDAWGEKTACSPVRK